MVKADWLVSFANVADDGFSDRPIAFIPLAFYSYTLFSLLTYSANTTQGSRLPRIEHWLRLEARNWRFCD